LESPSFWRWLVGKRRTTRAKVAGQKSSGPAGDGSELQRLSGRLEEAIDQAPAADGAPRQQGHEVTRSLLTVGRSLGADI